MPGTSDKEIAYVCKSESAELGVEVGQMGVLADTFCAMHLDGPVNYAQSHGRHGKLKSSA